MAKQQQDPRARESQARDDQDIEDIETEIDEALEDVEDEEVDERLDEALERSDSADADEVLIDLEGDEDEEVAGENAEENTGGGKQGRKSTSSKR